MILIREKPRIRFDGFIDDWERSKLSDIGEVITGSTPSTQHPEYYSEDGILWVTPTDMVDNVISDTSRKLSPLGEKVGRVVPADTILVTCIASIGKNAMLAKQGSFNQQINGLVPNTEKNDPYFLLTESFHWSAKMKREAAAGTMQIVNKNEFSAIETYTPKLIEQKAIGDYFRQIDKLITLHQHKYDKLVMIKKSMLEKMFPREGSLYPEIRFDGFTDPWEQRKLGDLFNFRYGMFNNNPSNGGQYPVYGAGGIQGGYTDYNAEDSVIIGHMGDAGCVTWGAGKHFVTYNGTITSPKSADFDSKYGYYLLSFMDLRKLRSGSGLPFLTYDMLQGMETKISTSPEERIRISSVLTSIDNVITLHQGKLLQLKIVKSSLLQKMFIK